MKDKVAKLEGDANTNAGRDDNICVAIIEDKITAIDQLVDGDLAFIGSLESQLSHMRDQLARHQNEITQLRAGLALLNA